MTISSVRTGTVLVCRGRERSKAVRYISIYLYYKYMPVCEVPRVPRFRSVWRAGAEKAPTGRGSVLLLVYGRVFLFPFSFGLSRRFLVPHLTRAAMCGSGGRGGGRVTTTRRDRRRCDRLLQHRNFGSVRVESLATVFWNLHSMHTIQQGLLRNGNHL